MVVATMMVTTAAAEMAMIVELSGSCDGDGDNSSGRDGNDSGGEW